MLYEVWIATPRPGARAEVLERIATALPVRERVSPLFGAWYVDIGALHQIFQVWAYQDFAHLAQVRTELTTLSGWPAGVEHLLTEEHVELWTGVSFLAPVAPGAYGQSYEMRTYTFNPGTMPQVLDVWAQAVPSRTQLSPLVACWYSDVGQRNRLRHIWAYENLDERSRIREEAFRLPDWPPMTREWRVHEESHILVPAHFSPLH